MTTLLLCLCIASGPAPSDTTVELRRGDRVVIERVSGELRVETWERSVLQVSRDGGGAVDLAVSRQGERVMLRAEDRKRRDFEVEAVIRIPEWVALEIQGRSLDVSISGTGAAVEVKNVSGDIRVEDTRGQLTLTSVEGEITVRGARGSVTARSRGDEVHIVDVVGTVDAESGSGNVHLEAVEAASVRGKTLDGDLFFSGTLAAGGTYWFSVHDGDADLELPPGVGAHVSVSTFDGEFTSDFPVLIQRYQGGGVFDFTLGDGAARLEVKVFDGEIRLHRGDGRRIGR